VSSGADLADFVSNLPTWTSPTVPSMPTPITPGDLIALTNAIPTYADIDLSSLTLPTALSSTFGTIPTITGIGDLTTTLGNITTTRIVNALNRASDFLDVSNADGSTDSVTIDTHSKITSHDVALANEATKAANAYTQSAQQEIQLEVAKLQNVDTEIKHVIADFNGQIQGYGLRYNGVVSEYKANIDRYISGVKAIIDDYAGESQSDVAKFTAEFNYLATKYKAEIDADIAAYGANVQAVLGEYGALVNKMAQEFQAGMSKAMAYLQSAQIRLQIGNAYTAQMGALPNEIALLSAQFENEVRMFCGLQPQSQQER